VHPRVGGSIASTPGRRVIIGTVKWRSHARVKKGESWCAPWWLRNQEFQRRMAKKSASTRTPRCNPLLLCRSQVVSTWNYGCAGPVVFDDCLRAVASP